MSSTCVAALRAGVLRARPARCGLAGRALARCRRLARLTRQRGRRLERVRQLDQRAHAEPGTALREIAVVAAEERGPGDVEVDPRHAVDELLQEQSGGERAALARADVLDVGDRRVDPAAVVGGQRERPHPLADAVGRGLHLRRSTPSSLPIRPAIFSPSATTQAPVSVARSITAAGLSSDASESASARMRRPSASVLSTSTVLPLRIRSTSPGRIAVPLGMFSTSGM